MITRHKNKKVYLDPNTMKPHRVDGPAVMYDHGSEEWWVNGLRHRINGPAVLKIYDHKIQKEWWVDGKLHRLDGPAIEVVPITGRPYFKYKLTLSNIKDRSLDGLYFDKIEEWWIDGIRFRDNLPSIVSNNGFKVWTKNGLIHRDNDYAISLPNGSGQIWCLNGLIHRDNGPAVILKNRNTWFKRNKIHRDEGPAEILHSVYSRTLSWICNGKVRKQFNYFPSGDIDATFKDESGELYSTDGPAVVRYNTLAWFESPGIQCRKDGPCLIVSKNSNTISKNCDSLEFYYCYDNNHILTSSFEVFLKSLSDDKKVDILFNINNFSNAAEHAIEIYLFYKNIIIESLGKNPLIPPL